MEAVGDGGMGACHVERKGEGEREGREREGQRKEEAAREMKSESP